MSKVYSFRLSDDNPREAQAREVIEAWVGKGFSLRHIITKVLLISIEKKFGDEKIYPLLKQIERMILDMENSPGSDPRAGIEKPTLS